MGPSDLTRRDWLTNSTFFGAVSGFSRQSDTDVRAGESAATTILNIGSRRELFVDRFLIDKLDGLDLKLHEPRPSAPLDSSVDKLEYGTVIKDGRLYRLYSRDARGAKFDGDETEVTRYYESLDGIHWTRPDVGLHEVRETT